MQWVANHLQLMSPLMTELETGLEEWRQQLEPLLAAKIIADRIAEKGFCSGWMIEEIFLFARRQKRFSDMFR